MQILSQGASISIRRQRLVVELLHASSMVAVMAKVNLSIPIDHDETAACAHLEALLRPQGPICPRARLGRG